MTFNCSCVIGESFLNGIAQHIWFISLIHKLFLFIWWSSNHNFLFILLITLFYLHISLNLLRIFCYNGFEEIKSKNNWPTLQTYRKRWEWSHNNFLSYQSCCIQFADLLYLPNNGGLFVLGWLLIKEVDYVMLNHWKIER